MLEEFVDQLALRDVTLVMQDWGGPIGLGLAGRRPELVRRVVLGNTWAWPTSTSEPRGKFSLIAGGPIGEFVQMNFNGFASIAISRALFISHVDDGDRVAASALSRRATAREMKVRPVATQVRQRTRRIAGSREDRT